MLFAWVPAWGASLALASALIAALELVDLASGCGLACTFAVIDAIPPLAKLVFGGLLGVLMWLARLRRPRTLIRLVPLDVASGALAAIVVTNLLPGGFGISFRDNPDWPTPDLLYVIGAVGGTMLGTLLERSCRRRLIEA